jgi:hypothetical protein
MDEHDALIEQIRFRTPGDASLQKIEVDAPAGHWLTASIVQQVSWFSLRFCADAVAQRHGFGLEEAGFEYPTDLEHGEDPFEGVRMYALDDEMFVSTDAFDRLMLRFFDQMTELASRRVPAVTAESWWPEYLASVDAVRRRVDRGRAGVA